MHWLEIEILKELADDGCVTAINILKQTGE